MPTGPEGALVRVRSKIADMIDEDSHIFRNLDGENGFFARINKYAESQGVKEDEVRNHHGNHAREIGGFIALPGYWRFGSPVQSYDRGGCSVSR